VIIQLPDSFERIRFPRKWLNANVRHLQPLLLFKHSSLRIFAALVLIGVLIALNSCSEDSGWNAGFSGMPMQRSAPAGENPGNSSGAEESAQQ
jgi:hypothetical protein